MTDRVEQMREANEDLKATIREAHETIVTMRLLLREMHEVTEEWAQGVDNVVDAAVKQAVTAQVSHYTKGLRDATDRAHESVVKEFDKIKNVLLYGNEAGAGGDGPEEWIRILVQQEIRAIGGGL